MSYRHFNEKEVVQFFSKTLLVGFNGRMAKIVALCPDRPPLPEGVSPSEIWYYIKFDSGFEMRAMESELRIVLEY